MLYIQFFNTAEDIQNIILLKSFTDVIMVKILYPSRFPITKTTEKLDRRNTAARIIARIILMNDYYDDDGKWHIIHIHMKQTLCVWPQKTALDKKKNPSYTGSRTKKKPIPTIWTRKCVAFFALIKIINNRLTRCEECIKI